MPLYIKDPDVDRLVERFMASSGAKTKTDAVRKALLESIATLENQETLAQRVAKIQARVAAAGLKPRIGTDKDLMDEMWGDD